MSVLSDRAIRVCIASGRIVIDPYIEENVQPASIDLTLDEFFKRPVYHHGHVDPQRPMEYEDVRCSTARGNLPWFELGPHGFCLASTVERIELPDNIVGRLEGKSSIGRLGLTAHVTAGFFDPGFKGHATLELFNANNRGFILYPGMKICQLSFSLLSSPAEKPYGHADLNSKYQNQERGPKGSQYHRNFE